jgi:hypothetical protein
VYTLQHVHCCFKQCLPFQPILDSSKQSPVRQISATAYINLTAALSHLPSLPRFSQTPADLLQQ